jgi:hypothetical protein
MPVDMRSGAVARISSLTASEIAGRIVATDLAAYVDGVIYGDHRAAGSTGSADRDEGPGVTEESRPAFRVVTGLP